MDDRYLWIKIAGAYIGAVIGAGFASGQENVQFFGVYGSKGIFGAAVAGMLFILMGVFLLGVVSALKTYCYQDLLKKCVGDRLWRIFDVLLAIFLFLGLVVMLAGSGAIAEEHLGIASSAGITGTAVIMLIVMSTGTDAVFTVNLVCVPALVIAGVWASAFQLTDLGVIKVVQNISREISFVPTNWFGSSVIYVAYNLLLALSLFCAIGHQINSYNTVYLAGFAGGAVLGGLLVLFEVAILQMKDYTQFGQIPMLYIASQLGQGFYTFYAVCLWLAMLTTGIANGYSLLKRIAPSKNSGFLYLSIGIIGAALPFTSIGFVNLIKTVYPFFGYVGVVLIILVIVAVFRRRIWGIFV
jgi:uncharacterized membrane protein YkvI